MCLIKTLNTTELPSKYGGIAEAILKLICLVPNVYFLYDPYHAPTIKGEEQDKKGKYELDIVITRPNQK